MSSLKLTGFWTSLPPILDASSFARSFTSARLRTELPQRKNGEELLMERAVTAADDDMALPLIEGEETITTVLSLLEKHPVELFQRVVTTSLETVKIVSSLPELKIG